MMQHPWNHRVLSDTDSHSSIHTMGSNLMSHLNPTRPNFWVGRIPPPCSTRVWLHMVAWLFHLWLNLCNPEALLQALLMVQTFCRYEKLLTHQYFTVITIVVLLAFFTTIFPCILISWCTENLQCSVGRASFSSVGCFFFLVMLSC